MILIDSSCWVEFYRPEGDPAIQRSVSAAVASGEAVVCGIVRVEILGFIGRKAEYDMVAADFAALDSLEISDDDFDTAVAFGRELRSHGVTVPATDLLIAAVAHNNHARLLHSDRHFETIAAHARLDQMREYHSTR